MMNVINTTNISSIRKIISKIYLNVKYVQTITHCILYTDSNKIKDIMINFKRLNFLCSFIEAISVPTRATLYTSVAGTKHSAKHSTDSLIAITPILFAQVFGQQK